MDTIREHFMDQLAAQLTELGQIAERARMDAREAARTLTLDSERREDDRAAVEFGTMAKAQDFRAMKAQEELERLSAFRRRAKPRFSQRSAVALGAIVDVWSDEEEGGSGRTVILLPVGAGSELQGPGGDGFVTVITPESPVGRELMGSQPGDSVEVRVDGKPVCWTVEAVS